MNHKTKILSGIITLSVITFLFLTGPARAFNLALTIDNPIPIIGDIITFESSAEIELNEFKDIQNFTLMLNGPQNLTCHFLPNGDIIGQCPGVAIQQIQSTPYQFGYGFQQGFMRYRITIDSGTLSIGDYQAKLIATTPSEIIQSSKENLTILLDILEKCSIRAEGGEATYAQESFTQNNRLSLNSPLNKANDGEGGFTTQKDRTRLSYDFDVNGAARSGNVIMFNVNGIIKKNPNQKANDNAIITFNMQTLQLTLNGDNLDINNMDVTFFKCE